MKKLMVMLGVVAIAIASNAASFKWNAVNIYASDGTSKYSGDVVLHAYLDGESADSAKVVNTQSTTSGSVLATASEFSDASLTAGNYYNFFFTIEDNGKVFTSSVVRSAAQATSTQQLSFGNMATATQNASNWGTVPEPTSALLMVLGVAGLALRRRRV